MNFYFYYIGTTALCLISAFALFEKLGNKRNPLFFNNAFYLILISIFLIINKLCFFHQGMFNIDESMMLSGGKMLGYDPRPWISVDPTTSGPANFLPAVLLLKIFDSASYGELRLLYVIAFQIPTLAILFLTISKVAGPLKARLAIIPLTLCFAFFYEYDHIHASSENLPMLFTAVGLSTIVLIAFDYVKRWQLILTGAACAIAPFAKLQAGPLLFFICFVCFALPIMDKKRWKDAVWLAAGFAITLAVILLFIYSYGGFYDFSQSYILSNLRYITNKYDQDAIDLFIDNNAIALMPLLLFLTFIFGWTAKSIKSLARRDHLYLGVFFLVLLVAGYCVIKPGRFFVHYGLLLAVPLYGILLWIAVCSSKFNEKLIAYFVAGIGILFCFNIYKTSPSFGWGRYEVQSPKIMTILIAERQATDRLAVWGWGTPYIHGANLLMGTRDFHYEFQTLYTGPIAEYYKNRFLFDLKENRPKWFLDISEQGDFGSSQKYRLENFRNINDFVKANYEVSYVEGSAILYRYKSKL